ncbi:MAG: hypothetical protein NZ921_00535 [Candidatus Caldarchaeum sp.]|nr:hypothetical protein [Candidatus Caldarchaeum sp.]
MRPAVALKAVKVAIPVLVLKTAVAFAGLEFMSLNPLVGSIVAGTIFVMGFVLAGVISDYKEAERMPGEIRSALDRIWTEARLLYTTNRSFDIEAVRKRLLKIVESFLDGVERSSGFANLKPCIESVDDLTTVISDMEKAGAPPALVSRVKEGRENLLRNVLRIYYIQRTVYLPSARFLAEFLMVGVITLLLFVESGLQIESFLQFGIITYLIIYLRFLTYALDTPFRQGERTQDDISLFLLKEYENKLAGERPEVPVLSV